MTDEMMPLRTARVHPHSQSFLRSFELTQSRWPNCLGGMVTLVDFCEPVIVAEPVIAKMLVFLSQFCNAKHQH